MMRKVVGPGMVLCACVGWTALAESQTVTGVPPNDAADCRVVSGQAEIDGTMQPFTGPACRQPDGTWKMGRSANANDAAPNAPNAGANAGYIDNSGYTGGPGNPDGYTDDTGDPDYGGYLGGYGAGYPGYANYPDGYAVYPGGAGYAGPGSPYYDPWLWGPGVAFGFGGAVFIGGGFHHHGHFRSGRPGWGGGRSFQSRGGGFGGPRR